MPTATAGILRRILAPIEADPAGLRDRALLLVGAWFKSGLHSKLGIPWPARLRRFFGVTGNQHFLNRAHALRREVEVMATAALVGAGARTGLSQGTVQK